MCILAAYSTLVMMRVLASKRAFSASACMHFALSTSVCFSVYLMVSTAVGLNICGKQLQYWLGSATH
jgi:hypothetical protein